MNNVVELDELLLSGNLVCPNTRDQDGNAVCLTWAFNICSSFSKIFPDCTSCISFILAFPLCSLDVVPVSLFTSELSLKFVDFRIWLTTLEDPLRSFFSQIYLHRIHTIYRLPNVHQWPLSDCCCSQARLSIPFRSCPFQLEHSGFGKIRNGTASQKIPVLTLARSSWNWPIPAGIGPNTFFFFFFFFFCSFLFL